MRNPVSRLALAVTFTLFSATVAVPLTADGDSDSLAPAPAAATAATPAISYARYNRLRAWRGARPTTPTPTTTTTTTTVSPPPSTTQSPPAASHGLSGNRALGYRMMREAGFGEGEWRCLDHLWGPLESGWRTTADNPHSSAYGIPQALPGRKMGEGWQHDPVVQIRWGLGYIRGRYGTPCKARAHRLSSGWY